MAESNKFKDYWNNLNPNVQKSVALGAGSTAILAIMSVFMLSTDTQPRGKEQPVEQSMLTDFSSRELGIDALNAKVKMMEKGHNQINRNIFKLQNSIDEMNRRRGNNPDIDDQIYNLNAQLNRITTVAKELGWDVEDLKDGVYEGNKKIQPVSQVNDISSIIQPPKVKYATHPPMPVINNNLINEEKPKELNTKIQSREEAIKTNEPFEIISISSDGINKIKKDLMVMPSGTIISGVLLNGLDAPTGRKAKQDPYPILVRIEHDAIMPNSYSADIKECFATLAGYGELSSERAYLRGETFSCITTDGQVIEETFPAYAVGEDGKAGIRGRLVTKAGSLIAKTATAGFLSGIAQAFDVSAVPVIQTDSVTNERVYQDNFSSEALQSGASSGLTQAFDRLADYYMDMADQMFPVIEVDAGRQVDIILTAKLTLGDKPKEPTMQGKQNSIKELVRK